MRSPVLVIAWAAFAAAATASDLLVDDNFDGEPADTGSPLSYSVYGYPVVDRGVTAKTAVSGRNSAYIVADFRMDTWGVILLHDALMEPIDLSAATLSAQVRASSGFRDKGGVVGFKLIDADGTGYRTADAELLVPTRDWQKLSQRAVELTQRDEDGEDAELDLKHIVQYGILFLDQGDVSKRVTFYVDDLQALKDDSSALSRPRH
ncbi:MAG: hypothetical protein JXB04_05600 [Kiritimatiellae bacterium]|nr:hypothetical protein [Kiritimatiellia bacterium]